MNKSLAILLSVLMGLFSLAACSSGGGDGGGGKKKTYDYKAALYGADESAAFSSLLGLNVPGTSFANSTSGTLTYKTLQSPMGPVGGGTATLTVDEYGFANVTEPGDDPMFGTATPDASIFFSIDTIQDPGVDEEVNLIVGTNRTSGMSISDINGLYTCAMMLSDGLTNSVSSFQIFMNGSGSFIGGPAGFGTYAVGGDGSLTFTGGISGGEVKGAVRDGGDVFFVSLNDPGGFGSVLCIDDEDTHTVSDLSDNYRFAGIGAVTTGGSYAFMGEVFFDGSGAGSMALIANSAGFINAPDRVLLRDVVYSVNGGSLETSDNEPIIITPSRDFFMIIDDDDSDGSTELIIGTKYTPPGFPTEYLGVSLGGDTIANLTGSVYSINTISNNIAPGESGTLGVRALLDTSDAYLSETNSFMVNSAGIIEIPGSTNPMWGFVNTTAKTFMLAATDQTSDDYVNLMPGVMAGTGLTNTTATMSGIYNCAAMAEEAAQSIDLDFTGNGQVSVNGYPLTYGLTSGGLLAIHDGPFPYYGMVQADTNMVVAILDALYICMKQPATLSIDGLVGTYVFGTFITQTGSDPDVSAEIGTVSITNSTELLGEAIPTTLYNSTGMVGSPAPQAPIPLFLNTTTNTFELGGPGGIPLWVSDDYNLFVIGRNLYPFEQLVFGIRK